MVQGKRKIKTLRVSVHQLRRHKPANRTKDLVQRKRRNKVLRESLHQVQGVEAPKRDKDLVQGKRRNKVLRGFVHQVRSRGAAHHRNPTPEILRSARLRPGTLVFRNERSRCTKCTAASSIYYAFFGVARSKAKPASPGSALVRSANSGGAHAARQRPAHAAKPEQPAHPTPTSAVLGCAP